MKLNVQELWRLSAAVRHARDNVKMRSNRAKDAREWKKLQARLDAELTKKIETEKKRVLARRLTDIAEGRA